MTDPAPQPQQHCKYDSRKDNSKICNSCSGLKPRWCTFVPRSPPAPAPINDTAIARAATLAERERSMIPSECYKTGYADGTLAENKRVLKEVIERCKYQRFYDIPRYTSSFDTKIIAMNQFDGLIFLFEQHLEHPEYVNFKLTEKERESLRQQQEREQR